MKNSIFNTIKTFLAKLQNAVNQPSFYVPYLFISLILSRFLKTNTSLTLFLMIFVFFSLAYLTSKKIDKIILSFAQPFLFLGFAFESFFICSWGFKLYLGVIFGFMFGVRDQTLFLFVLILVNLWMSTYLKLRKSLFFIDDAINDEVEVPRELFIQKFEDFSGKKVHPWFKTGPRVYVLFNFQKRTPFYERLKEPGKFFWKVTKNYAAPLATGGAVTYWAKIEVDNQIAITNTYRDSLHSDIARMRTRNENNYNDNCKLTSNPDEIKNHTIEYERIEAQIEMLDQRVATESKSVAYNAISNHAYAATVRKDMGDINTKLIQESASIYRRSNLPKVEETSLSAEKMLLFFEEFWSI
jgi:hypothetical protein